MLRLISLNLNGIRSAASKGAMDWLQQSGADIVCVQELKAQLEDIKAMPERDHAAPGLFAPNSSGPGTALPRPDVWRQAVLAETPNAVPPTPTFTWSAFHCAEKKGYSGVGIYAKREPDRVIEGFGNAEFDAEGRYLQADFGKLSVISLYLPSGSSSEERQEAKFRCMDAIWPRFAELAEERKRGREVVILGDWNIAHTEKDLKNWRSNKKNSGFLPEERAWLTRLFAEQGWVDVHRMLLPEAEGEAYTWWSNRGQAWAKNVGWRIDYQIATPGMAACARHAEVYKAQRFSDHAPLIIDYES
jgi:exodeoxyribonuclease-3